MNTNHNNSPIPPDQPNRDDTNRQTGESQMNLWKGRNVPPGQIVVTRNAANELPKSVMLIALARHCSGDWGDVCAEDWQANDEATEIGNRLLSVYHTSDGFVFWIITEWDRSVTTILLPDDY